MNSIKQFNFKNKNIFITGATSDIAICIAESFSGFGGNLILSDTDKQLPKLEHVKQKMIEKFRNNVQIVTIDLYKVNDIQNAIEKLDKPIDILINCAGNNYFVPALEVSEENWQKIIDVNLKGTFFLSQSIAKKMISDGIKGKIVNIGSQHGVVANGLRAPYCISKFGLIGLTKVLALEWSTFNILVNCVSPTYVKTSKSKDFLEHEDVKKAYLYKIPLKNMLYPTIYHMQYCF